MGAREEILGRLKANVEIVPMPPAWVSRRRFENLTVQFDEALTAVGGKVIRVDDFDGALAALGGLLRELGVEKGVVSGKRPLSTVNFSNQFPKIAWHIVGENDGNLRDFCAVADVGISGALSALAETGSVLIESGAGKSRMATLLPPVHIVMLSAECITSDLFTWAAARSVPPPTNMVFVSGPSKTADIEQTLAVGVHGPKRFIAIVYGVGR